MGFKVVKIVNEYLIVIDYGLKHYAEIGDILEIYQIGEEVSDPETLDSLGTLNVSKGKVQVKNVYDNMSLCESYETVTIASPSMKSFNQTLLNLATTYSKIEKKALEVNTSQITGGYNEGDRGLINLCDPVRIIKSAYQNKLEEEDSEE
jgi:hypothetical protein